MGVDAEMQVALAEPLTPDKIGDLSYRLYEAFGQAIWVSDKYDRRALTLQPDEPGEDDYFYTLQDVGEHAGVLVVSLWGRYYGPGYERGSAVTLCAIAEWLEFNIPGGRVFYGGDSGDSLELLDRSARAELLAHFYKHGHLPYTGRDFGGNESWTRRTCKFCNRKMTRYGSGSGYASVYCHGCGKEEETRDSGETWTLRGEYNEVDPHDRNIILVACDVLEEQGWPADHVETVRRQASTKRTL